MTFKESTVETFKGGIDVGIVSEGGSPTGYFLRRYIQEGTSFEMCIRDRSPSRQPFFTVGDMEPTRDPRLYENVACPGDTYCNGTVAPAVSYTHLDVYKRQLIYYLLHWLVSFRSTIVKRKLKY